MVATKAKADTPAGKLLSDARKSGITVIACPMYMKHCRVAEATTRLDAVVRSHRGGRPHHLSQPVEFPAAKPGRCLQQS